MSDDGYTWRDHVGAAEVMIFNTCQFAESVAERRAMLMKARASLTRAIALLPAPKDDDGE